MPNETVVNPGVGRPFALNRASQIFIRQYGGILAGLLAVIIIFTLLSPKFLSVNNMTNILLGCDRRCSAWRYGLERRLWNYFRDIDRRPHHWGY